MRSTVTKTKPAAIRGGALVRAQPRFPAWLIVVTIVLVTIALYWPVMGHDFAALDDDEYVTKNQHVAIGFTLEGVRWAFCNPVAGNWHPLTVLSHMLDCQLFDLNPWGHHLTSVLVHAVNTALVFSLLRSLTDATWRSLFVAALFGFHPLRVESVAWVAERKDVLSAGFGLLALIFYIRYAQRPLRDEARLPNAHAVPARAPRRLTLDYVFALLCLGLGLMSKAMLVTWPFVLMLLDYWPLGRFKSCRAWRLVAEKIPFFALAAAASVVTYAVQKHANAMWVGANFSLEARGANASAASLLSLSHSSPRPAMGAG